MVGSVGVSTSSFENLALCFLITRSVGLHVEADEEEQVRGQQEVSACSSSLSTVAVTHGWENTTKVVVCIERVGSKVNKDQIDQKLNDLESCNPFFPPDFDTPGSEEVVPVHQDMHCQVQGDWNPFNRGVSNQLSVAEQSCCSMVVGVEESQWLSSEHQENGIDKLQIFGKVVENKRNDRQQNVVDLEQPVKSDRSNIKLVHYELPTKNHSVVNSDDSDGVNPVRHECNILDESEVLSGISGNLGEEVIEDRPQMNTKRSRNGRLCVPAQTVLVVGDLTTSQKKRMSGVPQLFQQPDNPSRDPHPELQAVHLPDLFAVVQAAERPSAPRKVPFVKAWRMGIPVPVLQHRSKGQV
ncbi:hypothetical protein OGATHE_000934 [Ogataea polymorpha]|uniref:Uncharacterized protein n=1 Tax=Ogataea polymorpha TaxID=460523 RepID=A0A9P8PTS6_9ASCO|nr:hypothetical protein OGATHE_000934 [Ogataea polymorpha]